MAVSSRHVSCRAVEMTVCNDESIKVFERLRHREHSVCDGGPKCGCM